jgi:D-glycero-D-manno-heptose 1,7-bisphosphate phosphatase
MKKRALFLDRDGVINIDHGYVHKIEDFDFIPEIFDICRAAQKQDYKILIVTNQGGIARGYYTIADFENLTKWMEQKFLKQDIKITKTYFSPFHEQGIVPEFSKPSFDRKPNPGMIIKASEEFNIDLSESFLIGDSLTDIEAGKNAKLKQSFLIKSEAGDLYFYQNANQNDKISLKQLIDIF